MLSSSGVRGYQVIVFTEAVQKVKQMDKKTIRVRGVQLGTGSPRICVPVVAENETQLRAVLGKMTAQEQSSGRIWDLVEYRADYLSELNEAESAGGGVPGNNSALIYRKILERVLSLVRRAAGDIPVLFTVRTQREGGCFRGSFENYCALNLAAAGTGLVDLVDVELFAASSGDEQYRRYSGENLYGTGGRSPASFRNSEAAAKIRELIEEIHGTDRGMDSKENADTRAGIYVVGSSHDFQKTPSREVMISRLRTMQEAGCDISKLAVMPQNRQDVLSLMEASSEMYEAYADRPIITMSMGEEGQLSRMAGALTGSCISFAAAGKESAPGQMEAAKLRTIFEYLYGL